MTEYTRALAFHEAGHCWGFWHLGRRFRYATLRPRRHGLDAATVAYRRWWFDETNELATVAACGPLAEMRHRCPDWNGNLTELDHESTVWAGAQHDLVYIQYSDLSVDDITALRSALLAHWQAVSEVAAELLAHGTLSGPRTFEVLDATAPTVS